MTVVDAQTVEFWLLSDRRLTVAELIEFLGAGSRRPSVEDKVTARALAAVVDDYWAAMDRICHLVARREADEARAKAHHARQVAAGNGVQLELFGPVSR